MSMVQQPHQALDEATISACRKIIKDGSKSFYMASLMLPWQVRMASTALYAFCRVSDDIADEPNASIEVVDRLKKRLEMAYSGNPLDHPADRAFSQVVRAYDIPELVPMSMIEGFEWDLTGKRYETVSDIIDYSARVAGTVGVMMSIVMGRRHEVVLARACDLGVAMQLINIARDVGEDARNGRVYLPAEWLADEGIAPEAIIDRPRHSRPLARVVKRLLGLADEIYARGITGISELPITCRPGIRAAAKVYAEIGKKVRENGYNSIDQRAYTSKGKKLSLMLQSTGNPLDMSGPDPSPAMAEVDYLIKAASSKTDPSFGDGEWLVSFFHELERRDQDFLAHQKQLARSKALNTSGSGV